MINIAKITNPKYLFEHSKHEYYTEGDNEKGFSLALEVDI